MPQETPEERDVTSRGLDLPPEKGVSRISSGCLPPTVQRYNTYESLDATDSTYRMSPQKIKLRR